MGFDTSDRSAGHHLAAGVRACRGRERAASMGYGPFANGVQVFDAILKSSIHKALQKINKVILLQEKRAYSRIPS
jgi:hypothetical protein